MNKKQEELVREALRSNEVCDQWKKKIKSTFPDLVPRDTNCWYKVITYSLKPFFVYVTEWIDGDNMKGAGFGADGNWYENTSVWGTGRTCEKADSKDFKTFLRDQADARGMKLGVLTQNEISLVPFTIGTDWDFEFGSASSTVLWSFASDQTGRFSIFKNGKWSEPVKSITKKEAEAKLKMRIIG
jgi:hypothetical protein